MKIKTICSSIALFALAGGAFAQAYVGFGVGRGDLSVPSISSVDGGVLFTASGDKTTDTAYKLYAGYNVTPNWGVELGYNDLGSGYSLHGTDGGVPYRVAVKVDNWYVAGTGTLPLSNEFAVFAKLGWVANHIGVGSWCNAAICLVGDSHNRSQVMYGLGASYAFTKNWSARLEYEDYGKVMPDDPLGEIKAAAWNLSVKYSF